MPRPSWIPILMTAIGWPDDWQVSLAMDLWAQSEGAPEDWHNPFNATYLSGLGNHRCTEPASLPDGSRNTDHVSKCPDWGSCAAAYAEFWNSSEYNILDEVMHEAVWKGKLEKIFYAINGGPECPGCQGGKYPIMLYDYLSGHIRSQPSRVLVPGKIEGPKPVDITLFRAWHDLTLQVTKTIPKELRRIERDRRTLRNVVAAALQGKTSRRKR